MSDIILYFIKSSISVTIFILFYEIFLRRETWFNLNRYFLLFGLIFSFTAPLLDFTSLEQFVNSNNQFEISETVNIEGVIKMDKKSKMDINLSSIFMVIHFLGSHWSS